MSYAKQVKEFLWNTISDMAENPWLFARNPNADFTRKRKLDFENLMRFLISMQSGTTGHELLKYFDYNTDTASVSAFYQQRRKLLTEAFQFLMFSLNSQFNLKLYKDRYNLIACDGCEFVMPRNPNDLESFFPPTGKSSRGYNMLHATALFDILSKRYLDCIVKPAWDKNEFSAICDFIKRYSYNGFPIFIADRGFASYNFFAHAFDKGFHFLVRAKDLNTKRLLKIQKLPNKVDSWVNIILTRSLSKKSRKHPDLADQYRYVASNVTFDFIQPGSLVEHHLTLRIVRFEIADDVYENIITNLSDDDFTIDEIKFLYNLRWKIELSFRDIKHIIGITNFHSKKLMYIEQEIWARLILLTWPNPRPAPYIIC